MPSAIRRSPWNAAAIATLALLGLGLALLAMRVSAREIVDLGTEADRIYVADGFHDLERSPEFGPYRWTAPLAQLILPNWGPGRINVGISGMGAGAEPGEALLTISGTPTDHTSTEPGKPWKVQGWGISAVRNPTVTLEGPRLLAPEDDRELGRLVTHVEIFAPDARNRVLLHLALLTLSAMLLFICLLRWTGSRWLALASSAAALCLFGLLAIYRDPWMPAVAWIAPPLLIALLLLDRKVPWRAPPFTIYVSRITFHVRGLFTWLALTAAMLLLSLNYLNAFDAERMYQVTAGLAEYGVPSRYPGHETWTKYGFGQSLLAVPFYLAGKIGVMLGAQYEPVTRLAVSMTNIPLTALTCWLLYRASRRFARHGVALAVAATYLLATPALSYARTFFSEPAGGLLLLAAILLLVPHERVEDDRLKVEGSGSPEIQPSTFNLQPSTRYLLAGACLGAMIWLKPAFAIYLPAPALAVAWLALKEEARRKKEEIDPDFSTLDAELREKTDTDHNSKLNIQNSKFITSLFAFSAGPLVALAVQAGYNYLRYNPLVDAWLRTGYEREPGFSTPLLVGLEGLLLSPGKSLFLYAPVALLAPLGLWLLFRRHGLAGRVTALLISVEVALGLVFNATWWAWTGNFAWGPRLLVPLLPLLIWPLAALGEYIRRATEINPKSKIQNPKLGALLAAAWVMLAVVGATISATGALVDFQVYFRLHGLEVAGDPGEAATIYDPALSPILEEAGYLLNGLTAAVHRPSLADVGLAPVWDVLFPAALLVLALASLWLVRSSDHPTSVDIPKMPD